MPNERAAAEVLTKQLEKMEPNNNKKSAIRGKVAIPNKKKTSGDLAVRAAK